MCGIVGLHLRDATLYPQLGALLTDMLDAMCDRGPDSAGMAIYGNPTWSPAGEATVSVLDSPVSAIELAEQLTHRLAVAVTGHDLDPTVVVHAPVAADTLADAVRAIAPTARIIGFGDELTVLKGMGNPTDLAHRFGLPRPADGKASHIPGWPPNPLSRRKVLILCRRTGSVPGTQRFVLESHEHQARPRTRRRALRQRKRHRGGRPLRRQTARRGVDLEKALLMLNETFDGFYTLLVSNSDSFAVVRDPIACKPAIIAETDRWVAMASEYRALAHLPGIENARIFEPEPEEVYVWHRQ